MKKVGCLFIILFWLTRANAILIICYTYTGNIGNKPVRFYFQIEKRSSDMKNVDLRANAVFAFSEDNVPRFFTGRILKNNKVRLRNEKDSSSCLDFTFKQGEVSEGIYLSDGKNEKVYLTKHGELVDTLYNSKISPVDILMSSSLKNAYLVGSYEKQADPYDAQMINLKIINKSTSQVLQEISFKEIPTVTGNVIWPLFKNVEIGDYNHDGHDDLRIWTRRGKMGSALYAMFDVKENKFILNPEPEYYQNKANGYN